MCWSSNVYEEEELVTPLTIMCVRDIENKIDMECSFSGIWHQHRIVLVVLVEKKKSKKTVSPFLRDFNVV